MHRMATINLKCKCNNYKQEPMAHPSWTACTQNKQRVHLVTGILNRVTANQKVPRVQPYFLGAPKFTPLFPIQSIQFTPGTHRSLRTREQNRAEEMWAQVTLKLMQPLLLCTRCMQVKQDLHSLWVFGVLKRYNKLTTHLTPPRV